LSTEHDSDEIYVYARFWRKLQEQLVLDGLHLSDVLIVLRDAGYRKTGKLQKTKI